MEEYEILKWPDERLKQVAEPCGEVNAEMRHLAGRLHQAMAESEIKGIGIAAPQLGINKRIIILDTRDYDDGALEYIFDPKIKKLWGKVVEVEEGCLSFPDRTCKVRRYSRIRLKYKDLTGKKKTVTFEGTNAVVLQHEVDHLDGITMVDREIK